MKVRTLVVMDSKRNTPVIYDQLAALAWALEGSHFILVVSHKAIQYRLPAGAESFVTQSAQAGFQRGEGVAEVIRKKIEFEQVLCLGDNVLPIGKSLDSWASQAMAEYGTGLLGVRDIHHYADAYRWCLSLFAEWDVPYERDVSASETIVAPYYFMSGALAQDLFVRNLLLPEGYHRWELPWGTYLSWVTQLLGHTQVCWGKVTDPMPPLYCHHLSTVWQPDPRILSAEFKLYSPIDRLPSCSEERIRTAYRQKRAEG